MRPDTTILTTAARVLTLCIALLAGVGLRAEVPDDDFVIASVLIASPGEEVYSCLGHATLRLQCPDYDLDYVFSSESEDAAARVAQFFAGQLKMGVRAVPTAEYLADYEQAGRGMREYELQLPIEVKQRLWQQMDGRLELPDMPYDYCERGCAVSVYRWLSEAIGAGNMRVAQWPEYFDGSRKEIAARSIYDNWDRLFLSAFIAGSCHDVDVPMSAKTLVPADLLEVLRQTSVAGTPLLKDPEGRELLPERLVLHNSPVTPMMVAIALLALALANLWLRWRALTYIYVGLSTLFGAFIAYLVFFSTLPCTEWNLLLVPFFPLMVLLWRWRRRWALLYAGICTVWGIYMLFQPHRLFEPEYSVLAWAMAAVWMQVYYCSKATK